MTTVVDFQLSDHEFRRLCALVRRHTAIELGEAKRQLVYSRFSRRLRALGLRSFSAYCDLVEADDGAELSAFASAITTNFTRFFREPHHFEALPTLLAATDPDRPLRVWSAGCSTGEEAWSIAMTLLETLPEPRARGLQILATDLDDDALAAARSGVYAEERVTDVGIERLRRWFQRGRGSQLGKVRVRDALRAVVSFDVLNLMGPWPALEDFDLIFCRNVAIYFSPETRQRLFERFASVQAPGAHLIVGHAEHLHGTTASYQPVGPTIYRRCAWGAHDATPAGP